MRVKNGYEDAPLPHSRVEQPHLLLGRRVLVRVRVEVRIGVRVRVRVGVEVTPAAQE